MNQSSGSRPANQPARSWAVALREIGWSGYLEGVVFIGVLLVALVYLWRNGGLDVTSVRESAG